MTKENNHGTQSFVNGTCGPSPSKSGTSENACKIEETSKTLVPHNDFNTADSRLLPYHLYFSSKL